MFDGPTFAYLVQGKAQTLRNLRFPADRTLVMLSYDEAFERSDAVCIHDKSASWARGRNLLAQRLARLGPLPDYIVFCDDDVEFEAGGYEEFERAVAASRPIVGCPLMPKGAQSPTLDRDLPVQRALALDEQIVALHRDAIGLAGLSPLVDDHDDVSWYVSSLIFEYLAHDRLGPFCHQYNRLFVRNEGHAWQEPDSAYHRGNFVACVETWKKYIEHVLGRFDPMHVEQFDPEATANIAARRILAADIAPWWGPGATADRSLLTNWP